MKKLLELSARLRPVAVRLPLPILLVIFLWRGFSILPGYRYQSNPDGISYLTIARQYLQGHWHDAVNAYWSPLLSWLLIPFLKFGVEPLLATKILALLIGGGIIATAWWLGTHLRTTLLMRVMISVTLMPILYYFGLIVTTPDLLMTLAIVAYLAQSTSPAYYARWHSGAVSGVLVAIAYLAKAYALPVLLAHYGLTCLVAFWTSWRWNRSSQKLMSEVELSPAGQFDKRDTSVNGAIPSTRRVFIHTLAGLFTLSLLVGAWALALTNKYGSFTLGSTGRFNVAWNGPGFVSPTHSQGYLPPPNSTGTSAWDDATVLNYPKWNPFGTPAEREHFRRNRERNWNQMEGLFNQYSWLFWPIVLAGVVVVASRADPLPRRPGLSVLSGMLIFPIGYYFLHVESRFLSTVCVLLLMTGAFVIGSVTHALAIGPTRRIFATAILCLSFLWTERWNTTQPYAQALNRWSIAGLWNTNGGVRKQADALAGKIPPRASFASNGAWQSMLTLGFLLDLQYFGEPRPGASPADIEADLKKHNIEFLFIHGNPRRYPFVTRYIELKNHGAANLHIYDLRPPTPPPPTTAPAPATTRGA